MTDGTGRAASTPFGDFLREVGAENAATRSRVPSDPIPRDQWPRLYRPITPVAYESLRSLCYRACSRNDLPNSWGLLKSMGLLHRNRVVVAEDPNLDAARLAHAMQVDDIEVERRRYPDLGRTRRSFFGLDVSEAAIENRIRRFSPTAFRSDAQERGNSKNPAYATHRAVWEMRDLPFCLQHWDLLQDSCGCEVGGVVQGWTRTATHLHECDRCGDPLADIEAYPVPDDMRPALSILTAMVDPDENARARAAVALPLAIRHADRSLLYDYVVRAARYIDPSLSLWEADDARGRSAALWQVCNALVHWPHGYGGIEWHPDMAKSAREAMGREWSSLPATGDHEDSAYVRALMPEIVGAKPATSIAKMSDDVLVEVHRLGLVTQHYRTHGTKVLPAFDTDEVRRFGEMWRNRFDMVMLASELGIPVHGAEQIAALRLIPPDAPVLPGTPPHCHGEAIDAFLEELEILAVDEQEIDAPVRLIDAMRRVSGRAKPWGPVLQLLAQGEIPFAVSVGKRLSDSVVIPKSRIPRVLSSNFERSEHPDFAFAERMSQRDALAFFNVSQNAKRVLDGLSVEGIGTLTYLVSDVEARAQEHITLNDLAVLLKMSAPTAYSYLHDIGYREEMPGIWKRDLLEKLSR